VAPRRLARPGPARPGPARPGPARRAANPGTNRVLLARKLRWNQSYRLFTEIPFARPTVAPVVGIGLNEVQKMKKKGCCA